MSRIQTGRWSELLRRFLDQKGVEDVASELSPEISPVFILESNRPDWLILKAERMVSLSDEHTSGATIGPTMRLRNPLNSGVLATVHAIYMSATVNSSFEIRHTISNNNLAGGGDAISTREGRSLPSLGVNKSAMAGSFSLTIAPVGDLIFTASILARVLLPVKEAIVLSPGRAIDIGIPSPASAKTFFGNFLFTERRLPDLEA